MASRYEKEIIKVYEEFDILYNNLTIRMTKAVNLMARKIIKLRKQKQRLVIRMKEKKNEND